MSLVLLTYYSAAIVAVSVLGGMIPEWVRMTHRRTELAVSFVAGAMLGVALLHLLPHALVGPPGSETLAPASAFRWVLGGFLAMFFIERFFCFHHHDVPVDEEEEAELAACDHHAAVACTEHDHPHTDHTLGFTWGGAAIGLTLHSLLAGIALAASVRHAPEGTSLAGLGAFLAILLHKPFDAMTIAMLMERGGWSATARALVNGLFALVVPAGVALFGVGLAPLETVGVSAPIAAGIAFSAGVFLCVSMSDLLPELHFHHHDRIKLSIALLLGLGIADLACRLERHTHGPIVQEPAVQDAAAQETAAQDTASQSTAAEGSAAQDATGR